MNVLQRKMFANGDVANKSFSPALIGYYVSQGYNPAEIKAALPEAPYGLIEEIARIQGGVVNPGVPGPNSPVPNLSLGQDPSILETIATAFPTGSLQPGQMNPPGMPNMPGVLKAEEVMVRPGAIFEGNYMGVDRPERPTNVDPSLSNDIVNAKIQNLIEEKNRILAELGFPSGDVPELQALDREIEYLRSQLPSNTIDSNIEEELANLQAVENTADSSIEGELANLEAVEKMSSSETDILGSSQDEGSFYIDSKGVKNPMSPEKFKDYVNGLSPKDIQAMFQAPNVTFSQDLKNILSARAAQVKTPASLFDPSPEMIGKTQLNAPITPGTALTEYGGVLKDASIETAEELYNLARRGVGAFDYFFKSQEEYDKKGPFKKIDFKTGRFKELDDPINPYPTSRVGDIEKGFNILGAPENKNRFYASSIDEGGQARFGMTADELDKMVLNAKIADPLQKEIDDVAASKGDKKEKDVVEDKDKIVGTLDGEKITKADYETLTTDEILRVQNVPTTTEDADPDKINFFDPNVMDKLDADIPDVSDIGQAEREEQERVQMNEGSFFSDPKFVNFIRNLGLGLSGADDVASGLVAGTALGSQERDLREQEALKADREAELERIKAGAEGTLKPSDLVSLNKMTTEMSTNIKDFEGSRASIAIMNDAIALFEEAVDKNVKVTGLQGRISRFADQGKAFFNIDGEVSDATKIQNYIEQVKQRSIRDILRESGRTISDLDREIVDSVFGELTLTDDPSEILKKLKGARRSLMDSNADKQRAIRTNYGIISDNAYGATGIRTIAPYQAMVNQILNANPSDFSTMDPIQGAVITVDYRGKNVFGGG